MKKLTNFSQRTIDSISQALASYDRAKIESWTLWGKSITWSMSFHLKLKIQILSKMIDITLFARKWGFILLASELEVLSIFSFVLSPEECFLKA